MEVTKNRNRQFDCLNQNGHTLTEPVEIANVFNECFILVSDSMIGNRCANLNKILSSEIFTNIHHFEQVTSEEIKQTIMNQIKLGKSPGSNGIRTNILKSLAHCVSFVDFL